MVKKAVIVHVCDRCGHEHRGGSKALPVNWLKLGKHDLCPPCVDSFNRWMELPQLTLTEGTVPEGLIDGGSDPLWQNDSSPVK